MTKYYVRITEKEPLPSDNGLDFVVSTEDEGEPELLVVSKNEYNKMVDEFDDIIAGLQDDIIRPMVEEAVEEYLDGLDGRVINATYLKEQDGENKYSYGSLKTELDGRVKFSDVEDALSLSSTNPVQNKVIKGALDSKASNDHNHDTRYELSDAKWKLIDTQSNGDYKIYTRGKYVMINISKTSNTTAGHVDQYSLPEGYYPMYNCAAISSTHRASDGLPYASFIVSTDGVLAIRLRLNTYGTSVNKIYGQLVYPYKWY